MRLFNSILIGVVAFCVVGMVFATTPYKVQYQQPATIYVPAYSAQYSPVTAGGDNTLLAILEELKAIRSEVAALRQATAAPQQMPPIGNLSAEGVVRQRCAGCHTAGVADEKGGGFALVDMARGVVPLSLAEKRRVVNRVSRDQMPPRNPLVKAEKEVLLEAMSQ